MKNNIRKIALMLAAALLLAAPWQTVRAQNADRLPLGVGARNRVVIKGSRNARAAGLVSQGRVEDSMQIPAITLHFRMTEKQSEELERLLEEQQDPKSPHYHSWLTPEEFGERFGISAHDFARVREWGESQGFKVAMTSKSRSWVSFRGTAAQVRSTFGTELHRFRDQGQDHFANVSDIELPVELAPLVLTLEGLNDFASDLGGGPQIQRHSLPADIGRALAPGDMAIIYNLNPIYDRGIRGAGQKIAVIGRTAFSVSDVKTFRKAFGLSNNDPQQIVVPGFPDPGVDEQHLPEALADVEWAGASAPDATILYVYSKSFDPAIYAIDSNLAPVISDSYGWCEEQIQNGSAPGYARQLAQQANAQGITWVGITYDSGPSACQRHGEATTGLSKSVAVPASLPEVTAVGGTMFNEGSGDYWNPQASATLVSARSYIPEAGWNETKDTIYASGGGASALYPKPAWQTGPGVPNDNARHVPDIAFNAAPYHDAYTIVENQKLFTFGGTSAAGPFFAGTVALLNQYVLTSGLQAKPGLGNINPRLYQLARIAPEVFHDVTAGDNIIPCDMDAPGCENGTWGYTAGPGYDQVTGLGSIDFKNLFDNWSKADSLIPTTLSLTLTPSRVDAGGSSTMTATVKAAQGMNSPTGAVVVRAGDKFLGEAMLAGSGGVATATTTITGFSAGDTKVTVFYPGTTAFGSSVATAAVTAEASRALVTASVDPSPVYQHAPDAEGNQWSYTLTLTETAGVPATITSFSAGNQDLTGYVEVLFGSRNLPAGGSLSGTLGHKDVVVPVDLVFSFSGTDSKGQSWQQKVTVQFRGERPQAAIALVSSPAIVVKPPNGDSRCPASAPYYQLLTVRELNGGDVTLTKFLVNGSDFSSLIPAWFGAQKLPGLGVLSSPVCSQHNVVPTVARFEIYGTDATGKTVQAATEVEYRSEDTGTGSADSAREPVPPAGRMSRPPDNFLAPNRSPGF